MISISGHCIRFIMKICQTVVRHKKDFVSFTNFGGFSPLGPIVAARQPCCHAATAASAAARLYVVAAEVRKLAIIDFRSVKPLVNPLLNYLRRAFFSLKKCHLLWFQSNSSDSLSEKTLLKKV